MERGRLKNLPFFGSDFFRLWFVLNFYQVTGRFRLTKSKFQILSIFPIISLSKFFQIFQLFHLSNSVNFSKFFLSPLIWFLPRAVVFFSNMIAVAPKILLFFQILTVVFSWDWSWEFDMSWSGPYQKF